MRENFRAWAEALETFVLEVIFEERRDWKAKLTRALLFGGSKVFRSPSRSAAGFTTVRILRDKTLGVQVIAIGNLTVGGTGKTPVVEKFARELRDAGRNVAILSRGYRSKPAPLHTQIAEQNSFARRPDAAARRVRRQIAAARFRNGRRRTLHARVQSQGCRRAGGQGPREERALRD